LLLDASMVRRPLLEPNLSVGGLTFLGVSLCVFLMANVITGTPTAIDLATSQRTTELQNREVPQAEANSLHTHGPAFSLLYLLPQISTQSLLGKDAQKVEEVSDVPPAPDAPSNAVPLVYIVTAKVMAILSQLAIVVGLVLIGLRHFDNVRAGIAAATL